MNIQGFQMNTNNYQASPFANYKQDNEQEKGSTINGMQLKAKQAQNGQNDRMKNLYAQIEKVQENMQKIRENEKLTREQKSEQLEELQKQIQDIQKQIADTQKLEQEKAIKEQQEQREEEELKRLSPEEREQKIHEAQQEMLAGVAVATDHVKGAMPHYFRAKEAYTEGQLGMGSKFGGNKSVAAVEASFNEASRYATDMMKELSKSQQASKTSAQAAEAYQKYKKEETKENAKEESQEQKEIEDTMLDKL